MRDIGYYPVINLIMHGLFSGGALSHILHKVTTLQKIQTSIRSLTHPTAPCQECYQSNINDYFTCLTCESSIAREEQCVHSLNAND